MSITQNLSDDPHVPAYQRIVIAAIIVLAMLMTMKYFPGLENEPAYAGLAFQSIHPDAFAGDPYRGPETNASARIVQLSLVYALAKLAGEIWLDDRFLAVIYFAAVALSLFGIDKIARLIGLTGLCERLVILLVFAKDHAILDHKVLVAHHQGFNHGVFAIPIIVWLYYAALARKGLPLVLALSLLLLGFSLRNAPFAILIAMTIVFCIGTRRERTAIVALSVVGLLAVYVVLFHIMDMPDADRLELWGILKTAGEGDVNPFDAAFSEPLRFAVVNGIWLTIIASGFFFTPGSRHVATGIRAAMATAFLIWLLGGLYISFAPDALKFPILQGAAPTRALAWPQNIAYIALFASGLLYLRGRPTTTRLILVLSGLAALFIIGPGNIGIWTAVVILAFALALVLAAILDRREQTPKTATSEAFLRPLSNAPACVVAYAFVFAIATTYAAAAYTKAPAWRAAWQSGVFGDALPATWVGVDKFIRETVPNGQVVLPVAFADPAYRRSPPAIGDGPVPKLTIDRSLGTRTGRAMPIPEDFPGDFRDPEAWVNGEQQKQVLEGIRHALRARDLCAAASEIKKLQPVPDYLVLPQAVFGSQPQILDTYRPLKAINGYAVLKRTENMQTPCPNR